MSVHTCTLFLMPLTNILTRQSTMESNVRSYPCKLPLAIFKAQGVFGSPMVEGNDYLDCLAGAGTCSLGHNRSRQTNLI